MSAQQNGGRRRRRPARVSRRGVLLLGASAIAAGTAAGWWGLYHYRPEHTGARLSVQEAYQMAQAGEILLVDIRRPDEWHRTGVPEGAVRLDMRRDDFKRALAALRSETSQGGTPLPVALICAGGVRSARVVRWLLSEDVPDVMDVPAGMYGSAAGIGWLAAKLPVTPWQE